MAAGRQTLRSWAGIRSDWEQAQRIVENVKRSPLTTEFEDSHFEKDRRQRLLDRIRAEERAEGIYHPEKLEEKYDSWVNDGAMVS